MEDRRWTETAKCRQMDPEQFNADWTPGHPRYDRELDRAVALTLCTGCPVIEECAREALQGNAQWTVRAGVSLRSNDLSPTQRAQLRAVADEHRALAHA